MLYLHQENDILLAFLKEKGKSFLFD
jgi:hypothetical protein